MRPPRTIPWEEKRRIVFERDKYICVYCGDNLGPFHCDHADPLSRGGSHGIENLVTACSYCNLHKHNKPLAQWKAELNGAHPIR